MDTSPLFEMLQTLRGPNGCPWDREQSLADLSAYLIEEAHEAAAALDRHVDEGPSADSAAELSGELGDLLFQLCFVAQLAREQGLFEPQQIVERVHAKMVERHPHIYADQVLPTAEAVANAWERRKAAADPDRSILAGVPDTLPALTAAFRIGQKAARIGFDWPAVQQVRDKVAEETAELDAAIGHGDRAAIEEELGDLLLTLSSLARHLDVEPERALAKANRKFRRRFEQIEGELRGAGPVEAERLWQKAKRRLGEQPA